MPATKHLDRYLLFQHQHLFEIRDVRAKRTCKREKLIANEYSGIMLVSVKRFLAPFAKKLFHIAMGREVWMRGSVST